MEKLVVDFARQIVFSGPAKLSNQIKKSQKTFYSDFIDRKRKKNNEI